MGFWKRRVGLSEKVRPRPVALYEESVGAKKRTAPPRRQEANAGRADAGPHSRPGVPGKRCPPNQARFLTGGFALTVTCSTPDWDVSGVSFSYWLSGRKLKMPEGLRQMRPL